VINRTGNFPADRLGCFNEDLSRVPKEYAAVLRCLTLFKAVSKDKLVAV
jgi:hypothetical protein